MCYPNPQVDNLQEFIDKEISKKEAKERAKLERAIADADTGPSISTKKSWEQEIKEDTKIPDTAEELLRFYFKREKVIMEKLFGVDWIKHVKHPDWPRAKYTTVIASTTREKRSSDESSDEERNERARKNKRERMDAAKIKAKGLASFLSMNR